MININTFTNKDEILQDYLNKSLDNLIEKGKRATLGEERTWGGEKYKKEVDGWVKVSDGTKHTKKDEGEVDKKEAEETVKDKVTQRGGAQSKMLNDVVNNNMYSDKRNAHTSESLTHSVKSILSAKTPTGDKVISLFKEGLHLHEIVNLANTNLSESIKYIHKGIKDGHLTGGTENSNPAEKEDVQKPAKESNVNQEENLNEIDEINKLLDDLAGEVGKPIDYKTAWKKYTKTIGRFCTGLCGAMFVYGKGGVGKSFEMEQALGPDGLNLKEGDFDVIVDDEDGGIDGANIESNNVGIDAQTNLPFIKKDSYDYIYIQGGKLTARSLVKLMHEHNGKKIILDDCDNLLKDHKNPIIEFLKGALNNKKDKKQAWEGAPMYTEFSNIPGAKPVTFTTGKNKGKTLFELPSKILFTGQIAFISNLSPEDCPQAVMSRCDSLDLTMTTQETIDKIESILPNHKVYEEDGKTPIENDNKIKDTAFKYMNTIKNVLKIDDVQMRTFNKIYTELLFGKKIGAPLRETIDELNLTYAPSLIKRK